MKPKRKYRIIKDITPEELKQAPIWVKDLSKSFLKSMNEAFKDFVAILESPGELTQEMYYESSILGYTIKTYHGLIRCLLTVVRPAFVLGVQYWIYAEDGRNPKNKRIELKNHLQYILEIIDIFKIPNCNEALKQMTAMLEEVKQIKIAA